MTNENNNNDLVERDDDPTSELEAVTWRRADVVVASDSLEASAGTIDFAELAGGRQFDDDERHALERAAYELEQQRALRKGLEAEVRSRAEINDTLNRQVADLRDELRRNKTALDKKSKAVKSLRREIRERNKAFANKSSELEILKQSLAELEGEFGSTKYALIEKTDAVSEMEQKIATDTREIADLRHAGDKLDGELKTALARIDLLEAELGDTLRVLGSRDEEIEKLQSAVDGHRNDATSDKALSALLASKERELLDNNARLNNLETYADSIRQGLQDATAVKTNLESENTLLSKTVSDQSERIRTLSAECNSAKLEISDLHNAQFDLAKAHQEELRILRFELGEAQVTMSQNELINEQLASDLIQTRGFKESLEHMLEQNEESAQSRIGDLEKQLHKLRQDIVYFEEQLHTKNEAINCLLAELAAKRNKDDSPRRDAGNLSTSTPDEKSFEPEVDFRIPDSDRVSRFLIGEVDGQDVQFPLFKGRLTIGRAQTNDIQLTADYISRRHAVLVTEQDITRIIDWGSRNGVRVNGKAVTEHFLTSGDNVRIGTFDFLYEERKRPDKT